MNVNSGIFTFFILYLVAVYPSEQRSLVPNCDEECVCRPPPTQGQVQYVVGYGSFIKASSIKRTDPDAGESIPVIIEGYQRVWNAQAAGISYGTTYLGVEQRENSSFNGVVFPLPISEDKNVSEIVRGYDAREFWYCRHKLSVDNIKFLDGQPARSGEFWIYVNKPEFTVRPSRKYPIVQSYVDVFISGCMEIEVNFNLPGYTAACVKSTEGWNKYWVNDRIYPRRPLLHEPKASRIDRLLAAEVPSAFKEIRIE